MSGEVTVHDSPVDWVNDHIREYLDSDGKQGYEWKGTTILLLTTTGRRSGLARRTALIYRQDGDEYVVVASKGGSDTPPAWYLNLEANPDVQVQVKGETFAARARTATPAEKPRLWELMAEVWPDYNDYQTKTERDIPVVVLDRV